MEPPRQGAAAQCAPLPGRAADASPHHGEQRTALPTAAEFRTVVTAVRRFLLANADRIPHDEEISHKWLTDYIVFHAVRGTLAVAWQDGFVVGVAIAWQMNEKDLRKAHAAGRDVFTWRPNDPTGDCVYLCLVVTEAPGAVRMLARYFLESCPMWRELNQFAHRRGKLVVSRNLLQRLCGEPPRANY